MALPSDSLHFWINLSALNRDIITTAANISEKCSVLAKALWKILLLPVAVSHSVALPRSEHIFCSFSIASMHFLVIIKHAENRASALNRSSYQLSIAASMKYFFLGKHSYYFSHFDRIFDGEEAPFVLLI